MTKQLRKTAGFTLIELIITLAIAAILVSIAAPSFTDTVRNNRMTTNANLLLSSLNIARSEAIKRGVEVTIRRKGSTSQSWESGWDIFTDINGNGTLNDTGTSLCEAGQDCLIKTVSALPSGYTLHTGQNYKDSLSYKSDGLVSGLDTFVLCNDKADKSTSRSISISIMGRVKIKTGAASSCS